MLTLAQAGAQRIGSTCAHVFVDERHARHAYAPPEDGPPSKFIIFTRGRSGSTLLVDLLKRHPAIRCHHEALSSAAVYADMPMWTKGSRDANRSGFLDSLYTQGVPERQMQAVGFKAFPQQLTRSEFIGLGTSPHVKKIVLRRSNLLDVYVSEIKARKLGEYKSVNTSSLRVHVFLTDFRAFVRNVEREYGCIDSLRDGSWLGLSYDEIASAERRRGTMQRVFEHLGVMNLADADEAALDWDEATSSTYSPAKMAVLGGKQMDGRAGRSSTLMKQDVAPHSSSIDNFAQLVKVFKGTRFESMLRGA
uniref:Protein-tyrosine sulfotransferase n=1 Tax=Coccolithus braarudii TaxID=221442 RepID=A0A7S0Q6T9_9EUKA|mmetsp:Transcript_41568/g.88707  ORF Transcript_41568/g.88707 Transcript_41568/m.88707 type:complete len:306 (+) Transcript_41568:87-1004(+)